MKTNPLYHLSFNRRLDKQPLVPRQPHGSEISETKESIYTERLPDRVSFSPTVEQCFMAIYPNISKYFEEENYPYIRMYLYQALPDSKTTYIPEDEVLNNIPDAHVTGEVCVTSPVRVKLLGEVEISITKEEVWYFDYDNPKLSRYKRTFLSYKPVLKYVN